MKIPNLLEIAKAWKIAANPTPDQEALAAERLAVCDPCEHKEFVALTRYFKCNACGCPLSKKVYTPAGPDACPAGKWSR